MTDDGKLGIFLDTASIGRLLANSDDSTRKLLLQTDDDMFEFTRSEGGASDQLLSSIRQAEKRTNSAGDLTHLEINTQYGPSQYAFGYRSADVEAAGKFAFGKNALSLDEKERNQLVFIQSVLNHHDGRNLFVTGDDILLRRRLWFESHFPGGRLNIATVQEAIEIIDLLAKSNGKYIVSRHYRANKGLWYWYSFRSKVPFYNVPPTIATGSPTLEELNRRHIMESFASRFVFLLTSIDEMGIQYYSGADNDTMDSTLYHFNYFISLITGIFDSLAIETKDRLHLRFEDDRNPSRTSLSTRTGRYFLAALREVNRPLRQHINSRVSFINLIYSLRESFIHREGLRETGFEFRSQDERWRANFLKIPEEISSAIRQLGDRARPYDVASEWGVYRDRSGQYLLPFYFAKSAALELISFSNQYLQLLGFTNFVESQDAREDFRRSVEAFKRDRLGF